MTDPADSPAPAPRHRLVHNAKDTRYEIWRDDERVGLADYVLRGDTVIVTHTWTDPARRGHGLAADLTRFAMDDIRASKHQVIGACSYTAGWLQSHPEFDDIRAD